MNRLRNEKGFFGLISMLIAVAVIAVCIKLIMDNYYKKPKVDEKTKRAAEDAGLDLGNNKAALESAKSRIAEIERMQVNRPNDLMKQAEQYQH